MENTRVIELARQLGAALQEDEKYTAYLTAKTVCDEDMQLQESIGKFNLKRLSINAQMNKPEGERDKDKFARLNAEMTELYSQIMEHEGMKKYNEAKKQLDDLLNHVVQIINMSANGEDPATADPTAACTGSCATCGGCH